MTDSLRPIGPSEPARSARDRRSGADRRAVDDEPAATAPTQLPVPVDAPRAIEPPAQRRGGFASFFAQMMGQGGQKRGLRGGPETLDRARTAYLETEWSGPADRRPRPGGLTKPEI